MNAGTVYKVAIAFVFEAISIAMILVGVIISLCVIANSIFDLGWGYPWWGLLFCIVYLGLAIAINRWAHFIRRTRG